MDKRLGMKKKIIVSFIIVFVFFIVKSLILNPPEKIKLAGKMNGDYKNHSSILLDDGRVLIVGTGCGEKKAEIYDYKTDLFTVVGTPNFEHFGQKTVLLKDGNVLIVSSKGIELFSKRNKTFKIVKNSPLFTRVSRDYSGTKYKKIYYANTSENFLILKNGNILVFGGEVWTKPNSFYNIDEIETYDPIKITKIKSIRIPYRIMNYELLKNGDVLFNCHLNEKMSAEIIYNPDKNTYKIKKKYYNYNYQYSFKMNETTELLIKINKKKFNRISVQSILYNPITHSFKSPLKEVTMFDNLYSKYFNGYISHPIMLKNSEIVFLGENMNFMYDPALNKLYKIHNLIMWRENFTTTELNNGDVLITGGSCGNMESHSSFKEAELFKINK